MATNSPNMDMLKGEQIAAANLLLANLPDEEMYRLLDLAGPERADDVRRFLAELAEIRATGLAFNRGTTLADAFVVATPLFARDGSVIAAISAAVEPPEADRLDQLGEELKRAVAELARRDHLGRTPQGE
jgi:IclR family acetate operon transcriptional repressor